MILVVDKELQKLQRKNCAQLHGLAKGEGVSFEGDAPSDRFYTQKNAV